MEFHADSAVPSPAAVGFRTRSHRLCDRGWVFEASVFRRRPGLRGLGPGRTRTAF